MKVAFFSTKSYFYQTTIIWSKSDYGQHRS